MTPDELAREIAVGSRWRCNGDPRTVVEITGLVGHCACICCKDCVAVRDISTDDRWSLEPAWLQANYTEQPHA